MFAGWLKFFKDVLFPIFCVECGKEGKWWCEDCLKKQKVSGVFLCPVCHTETANGEVCEKCARESYLDGVSSFFIYDEKMPAGKLIRGFKYNYATDIAELWKKIIFNNAIFDKNWRGVSAEIIIPVPLHPRRERERGFNQAKILADIFAKKLFLPVVADGLVRARYTAQQAKLAKIERRKNIEDAFVWKKNSSPPERIILVDDVFTTGATMQECAKVLKQNGAKFVWGVVLARG
ncbi:MAG: ComF family protein [Patescibacteria group bacterium]|nr:ComF family protein [Patescibacteria group bacterium]